MDFILASWLIVHVLLLTIISYFSAFGGVGYLAANSSQLCAVVISVIFYYIGLKNSKISAKLTAYILIQRNFNGLDAKIIDQIST